MRRTIIQAALLALVLLVTVPPLALLCRGRSPSRFETANLPPWERRPPRPAPQRVALRAVPLTPGQMQWDNAPWLQALRGADENRLMAGMESPSLHSSAHAGDTGRWLEAACALGRQDALLAAKQDRVALRLMNAQDNDGYLAVGHGSQRWSEPQIVSYSRNMRGLLAYNALSHNPAAIYSAMSAGDLIVSTPALSAVSRPGISSLVLPLARLYLLTGEVRYRRWALREASRGKSDGAGWCALYLATAQRPCLQQAQKLWKVQSAHGAQDQDLAAALLVITGAPGYAKSVRLAPAPWPCPLAPGTIACTRAAGRLVLNAWGSGHLRYENALIAERVSTSGGTQHIMLIVNTAHAAKFAIALPMLAPGTVVAVNTQTQIVRPGQTLLILNRLWKNRDQVRWSSVPEKAVTRPASRMTTSQPVPHSAHGRAPH